LIIVTPLFRSCDLSLPVYSPDGTPTPGDPPFILSLKDFFREALFLRQDKGRKAAGRTQKWCSAQEHIERNGTQDRPRTTLEQNQFSAAFQEGSTQSPYEPHNAKSPPCWVGCVFSFGF